MGYLPYDLLDERERESSGLGLYIAKLFTENIGGRIRFETENGKGTTFYVTIPKNVKKQQVESQRGPVKKTESHGWRII